MGRNMKTIDPYLTYDPVRDGTPELPVLDDYSDEEASSWVKMVLPCGLVVKGVSEGSDCERRSKLKKFTLCWDSEKVEKS
jgi:hypothetical protein